MKFDWKYIGLTVMLLIGSLLAYIFSTQIIKSIQAFFEFPYLNICAGTIATIITLVHKIKTRKFTFSASMSFNEFRIPVEDFLSFIGGTITVVGSLSLAKGIYLQSTTDTKYFPYFNNLELIFIGLVAAYLFFISVMELGKQCKENFILKNTGSDQPQPIPESEVKDEVTPKVLQDKTE